MANKLLKFKFKNNFISRILSVLFIIPIMIVPILMGGYVLIISYLMILSFIVDELYNMIRNSFVRRYSYIYLFVAIISIFIFNILLLSSYSHKNFFILIIFTIWIFDTFSYLGGSIIKGKKIFPNISKGKTYSGLISGIFGVTVIYFFF